METNTPSIMPSSISAISRLTLPEEGSKHQPQLCQTLQDCVSEGSSIGFLHPLSYEDASTYWDQTSYLITTGTHHLFILTSPSSPSTILATIQLVNLPKVTHSHQAEVVKLLVSPQTRRQGLATQMMDHVEEFARKEDKEFLMLDTATASLAREMYRRFGWEEWGTGKDYASWPDGSRCDATFFKKELRGSQTSQNET